MESLPTFIRTVSGIKIKPDRYLCFIIREQNIQQDPNALRSDFSAVLFMRYALLMTAYGLYSWISC